METKLSRVIVATRWQPLGPSAQVFAHLRPINRQWLYVLQDEAHARPRRLAWVTPCVHSGALYGDVAAVHGRTTAVVENHLDTAFEDDAKVNGLRAMHHAFVLGREVYLMKAP